MGKLIGCLSNLGDWGSRIVQTGVQSPDGQTS